MTHWMNESIQLVNEQWTRLEVVFDTSSTKHLVFFHMTNSYCFNLGDEVSNLIFPSQVGVR